jgi:hypothetical protein
VEVLLPDEPRQQPTDGFGDASNYERDRQPDEQDDERNEQRDTGRSS